MNQSSSPASVKHFAPFTCPDVEMDPAGVSSQRDRPQNDLTAAHFIDERKSAPGAA
ncbi:MAG: hypothetical protein ABL970_06635 [Nitrospira sp.]